jgi:NAD(P)-dependent dehydrogenase (short-subunit alcohol dehydrogenase family)
MTMATTDLTGQVAVVTGGSLGLGRAIAAGLASAGAAVVVVSRSGKESTAAAAALAEASGIEAVGLRCDVTIEADIDSVVQTTLRRLGRIDILVNSAGINIRGPIEKLRTSGVLRRQLPRARLEPADRALPAAISRMLPRAR